MLLVFCACAWRFPTANNVVAASIDEMNRPDSNIPLFIFNFSFIIALSTMSNIRFHLLTTQDATTLHLLISSLSSSAKDILAFNDATRLLGVCLALPEVELANGAGALIVFIRIATVVSVVHLIISRLRR